MSSEPKSGNIVVPVPPIGGDWKKWVQWILIAALAVSQVVIGTTSLTIVEQNKEVQKEVNKEVVKEKVKEAVKEEIQSFLAAPGK